MLEDLTAAPDILAEILTLNEQICRSGENIEGNVCYWDNTPPDQYRTSPPIADPDHVAKRTNLATLARRRTTMLEIGLNGGHSALICLLANPQLTLFSVDICVHQYTKLAARYLATRFGRRFNFWPGDSREVMPRAALERPKLLFDLLHVDGGHGAELAMADVSNALRMAVAGADFVLDDVNAPALGAVLQHVTGLGYLAPLDDYAGLAETALHQVMQVC